MKKIKIRVKINKSSIINDITTDYFDIDETLKKYNSLLEQKILNLLDEETATLKSFERDIDIDTVESFECTYSVDIKGIEGFDGVYLEDNLTEEIKALSEQVFNSGRFYVKNLIDEQKNNVEYMIINTDKIVLLSGEGDRGHFTLYRGDRSINALRATVSDEKCNGDRWVRVFLNDNECVYTEIDIDSLEFIDNRHILDSQID